ncbi:MAG TPA: alpha/beta hydrolase domain-containing protein [Acidimicrobiia bacterium]|nr:alpha/beta hydrolase domain-containing protein [Acidimicrobiia bacterium]
MSTDGVFDAQVTGPIAGAAPMVAGTFDLAARGYVEEEFFLAGNAVAFDGDPSGDGHWEAKPVSSEPFTTRLLVRRPRDASAFNGTVLVEWLNVSGGGDGAPEWAFLHRELVRSGSAWVGVSAQKVGIDGGGFVPDGPYLKNVDPARYGDLVHPGDAYSYDMFTQAGRAVRGDAGVALLGDLQPGRLLAAGESQSAAHMVTYINGIDPQARVFDGFLVHGRSGSGAGLAGFVLPRSDDGEPLDLERARQRMGQQEMHRIRADVRVPVMTVQSETDVLGLGGHGYRQDDDDRTRLWEIAGTAHGDGYLFASGFDDGTLPPEKFAAMLAPTNDVMGAVSATPINNGPHQHYVEQAAFSHLDAWVRDGTPPPHAPRMVVGAGGDFERDEHGIARGGIRTPWVDAPTSRLSGVGGSGGGFAMLFGIVEPWDAARVAQLYPGGKAEYLERMRASLADAIAAGFVLAADQPEIDALLGASYPAP